MVTPPAPPPPPAEAAPAAENLPGGIHPPDDALLEPAPDFPGAKLPRIAADGRVSAKYYARPFNNADKRPRVAVLVVGVGLSDQQSRAAIDALPPDISLGMSPYSQEPQSLLAAATARGHEFFVTLPMESQGYPLNDSGPHALLTGADPGDNARNLEWVLSRMQGEVGISGASDGLRGERFAAATSAIGPVMTELAQRGLLYVDPRRMAAADARAGQVGVTMVLDDIVTRADLDAKLAELEQRARDAGSAVGLAGTLRPVTVDRIAAWARGLDGRGIDLVPVSAMAHWSEPQ